MKKELARSLPEVNHGGHRGHREESSAAAKKPVARDPRPAAPSALPQLRVLELFAGSCSIGKVATAMGMKVKSVDLMPYEGVDVVGDLLGMSVKRFADWAPDIIWASPPCFTGDQLVLTLRGHIPIKEVREGDMVLTHKCRWRPVIATGRKQVNTVKVLKGWGTNEVKATSNHAFLCRTKTRDPNSDTGRSILSASAWVEAKDTPGKHWAVPLSADGVPHSMVMDHYLLGRWLGDGWANVERGEVMICAGHHKADALQEKLGPAWKRADMRTAVRFTLADRSLAWWLAGNFRLGAPNKLIPGWVFGLSVDERRVILKGYLDSDGHETADGQWKAATVSPALAHGIHLLAITLGYAAQIVRVKRPRTAVIEGRTVNQRHSYGIDIRKRNADKEHFVAMEDGLGYGAVRSATWQSGEVFVYDITVAEDHTYTVNNVVVHNCTGFSVASIGRHWGGGHRVYQPKSATAYLGLALVKRTQEIIAACPNAVWFMENPRGVLRKLPITQGFGIHHTVSYCRYGDTRMKPTDIWTNCATWPPRAMCRNGSTCHEAAPRGSRTGTQGLKGAHQRAIIPEALCREVLDAAVAQILTGEGSSAAAYEPVAQLTLGT
jgi:hypothetical protein